MRRMAAVCSTRARISFLRHALRGQWIADVLTHVHVRVEREELEDKGDVACRGATVGDVLIAEQNTSRSRQFQAGDHSQGRGLAAAGRTEQAEERAVRYGEARILHRNEVAEGFLQMFDLDFRHRGQSGNFETTVYNTTPPSVTRNDQV